MALPDVPLCRNIHVPFFYCSHFRPAMCQLWDICAVLHSRIGSVGWRYGSSGHYQMIQNFIRFDIRSVAERIGMWEISGFTFHLQIELLWLALPVGSNKGFSPTELQYAFLINVKFSGTCSAWNWSVKLFRQISNLEDQFPGSWGIYNHFKSTVPCSKSKRFLFTDFDTLISLISDKGFTMEVYRISYFEGCSLLWWHWKTNSCTKNCIWVLWSKWRGHISRFLPISRIKLQQ